MGTYRDEINCDSCSLSGTVSVVDGLTQCFILPEDFCSVPASRSSRSLRSSNNIYTGALPHLEPFADFLQQLSECINAADRSTSERMDMNSSILKRPIEALQEAQADLSGYHKSGDVPVASRRLVCCFMRDCSGPNHPPPGTIFPVHAHSINEPHQHHHSIILSTHPWCRSAGALL